MKNLKIKDWPQEERPYEKMYLHGSDRLSDAELLAIILASGGPGISSIDLARLVLVQAGDRGLAHLSQVSLEELMSIPSIGRVKALRLKACAELAKRMLKTVQLAPGQVINRPALAIAYFKPILAGLTREEFYILLLDTRKRLIRHELVAVGGLDSAGIKPRDVFRQAIKADAKSIILAHNHPSGDASPSQADLTATSGLIDLGRQLGVHVDDHIIIGDRSATSIREEHLISFF